MPARRASSGFDVFDSTPASTTQKGILMKKSLRPDRWSGLLVAALATLLLATSLSAQSERGVETNGTWIKQGPAPATDGQIENVIPNDEVSGAIEAVVTHPDDADIIYVGGVNAGIWKTENATDPSPSWTNLTDDIQSLSIGSLDLDPTDTTHQTLVAGIGRFSSYLREGGERIGLLRTTDGGSTWNLINGGGTLTGQNVAAVAARGSNIVAAVNASDTSFADEGIYLSTDGGTTFTNVAGAVGSGLPAGRPFDLGRDRANPSRLFTSMTFVAPENGIYRSTDTGATWTKVSTAAVDAVVTNDVSNLEFSISGDVVYAGIVVSGRLAAVFRSSDGGDSWDDMGIPTTNEDGFVVGANAGGQGSIHFSIQADPQDSNIVYVGGDRQPGFTERSGGSDPFFPNSIGARDFSGRLFRGEYVDPTTTNWAPLTHVGTASNSSPHADSREMAFDINGDLIEVDDGGIYRRTSPQDGTGDWFSINGDMASTEYHGIAYDSLSDIIIGGAQDVGTTEQLMPNSATFRSVSTADGGDVAIDNVLSASESIRYSSFQGLGAFRRRVMSASNSELSRSFPLLTVTSGPAFSSQFYSPIMTNAVEGNRLLVGASSALYESTDGGATLQSIGNSIIVNAFVGDPLIYGISGDPNLVLAASGADLYSRTAAPPAAVTLNSEPTGSTINGLAINPADSDDIFALSTNEVAFSSNFGTNWTDVTGNLASFNPRRLRAMAFASGPDPALLVGTDRGIFVAFESSGYSTWARLGGDGLPNAPVFELDYNVEDDVLVVGLLGRGAWKYGPASDLLFSDRFENEVN